MTLRYTFPKKQHVCGEIRISALYAEGKAFIVYPLRVVYRVVSPADEVAIRVLVGVPKKRFKHAVKRNRIKRLLRECYRLNKLDLWEMALAKDISLQIAFNYVADTEMDFASLQHKMKKALAQIAAKIE